MKRIIGALLITTFLNGCSLPLIGSLTSSTVTGIATGNYQQSLQRKNLRNIFLIKKLTGQAGTLTLSQ